PLLPVSRREDDASNVSRPFDAHRDGFVNGEGAGALVLENRRHAEARGANILARVAGSGGSFEPGANGKPVQGDATRRAISGALRSSGLAASDLGHVNAHGLSTVADDRAEAQAIRALLGDVPVTAPKSFFGNLGAGTGAVELAVSVLALDAGEVPVTLNYDQPDPACPVNVIHGKPLTGGPPAALILNQSLMGQSVAVIIVK
ncbi:MAG: beta-ketoacyl synthase N-terminal-like domain-containing protein, partial [Candidatus Saccharimonadales bacterium]